jgi:putative spermidine/putrescine transport system substrate-binding protein
MPTTQQTFTPRRVGALAAGLALALTLTSCAGAAEESTGGDSADGDFSGQTLTVAAYAGSWGDSLTKAFVQPFEEETGAKVNLVPGGPAEWLTTLKASAGGAPPFDLVAFTPDVIPNAVASKVVQPLDLDRIADFGQLNEKLVEQSNIDSVQYGVPLTVGSTGLAYRTDRISEAPTDWSDIFNPEYCGHIAISPLTFNTGIEFLAGIINEDGGSITNDADVDAAFKKLETLKDCASAYPADGTSVETALQNGDAWIAAHWDGRAFVLQNDGQPIGYSYPTSGSIGALTSFFVTENTPNEDLAYEFLNYLASSDYQPTFSEGTWYAASNNENVYSETFSSQITSGADAYDDFVWIDYPTVTPQLTELQDRWQEIFSQ